MAEWNDDQRLEKMLDSLLASYSDEQPRPGLQTRVLANLRAQAARERPAAWRITWWWSISGSVAAMTIVFAFFLWQATQLPPPPPGGGFTAPAPPVAASVPKDSGLCLGPCRTATKPRAVAPVVESAQLEVFPSPSPLSSQEKLLLQYVQRTPAKEVILQSHADVPLESVPLEEENGPPLPQVRQPKRPESYDAR